MKLYEVNARINELIESMEPDADGNVSADMEEAGKELNALLEDRDNTLEYLAKIKLNTASEIAQLKAEEARLASIRHRMENKEKRVLDILDREIGDNYDWGFAKLSYRKTSKVSVDDYSEAVAYMKENNLTACYKVPEIELNKTEIKKVLSGGTEIPGISIEQGRSVSLR